MEIPFSSLWGFLKEVCGLLAKAKLAVNLDRERCWQIVDATVTETGSHWKMTTSAADTVAPAKVTKSRAVYLRVYLTNHGRSLGKDCRVSIRSIKDHTGRLLDGERSQLAWKHEDESDQFVGRTVESGRERGLYVDLCSCIEGRGYLQIESHMSRKGYHQFRESGCFTIELEATVEGRLSVWAWVRVHCNCQNWRSLCFVQATACESPFVLLPPDGGWVRNWGTKEIPVIKPPRTPDTSRQPEPQPPEQSFQPEPYG
jgi:hypothetical protein